MQHALDLGIYHAVDVTADAAVDVHRAAGSAGGHADALHLKAGALDDGVAQHQDLRQNKQYQDDGNDGAAAQALADSGDNGVGGQHADQHTRGCQDGAGGEDGREGFVQSRYNGLFVVHDFLQVGVVAGDNDGVVNVRAHLDRVDDEVTQEVQLRVLQIRERKVDPDTALNDDDEQHRQTGRLEGEQQNQNNEQRRQHADEQVVLAEGAGQVHGAGGIAYHVVVTVIILAHDVMDLVHKGESLVAFLGHVQVGDQAAVLVTLQLDLSLVQLGEQVVQRVLHIAAQGDVAVLHLLFEEHKHIVQRNFVVAQAVDDLAILVVLDGVGTIQSLGNLVVQVGQLGELARGQGVGQHVAVHGFDVGQTLGRVDLGAAVQLGQNLALGLVIARRYDDGHHVAGAKLTLDLLVGGLTLTLLGGDQVGVGVAVGAQVRKNSCRDDDHRKDGRHDVAGLDVELAYGSDPGHQVLVAGLVDQLAEQHQQAGHQRKDRQHTEQDGLDQHSSQVAANAKVHERQGGQAADGGQRGGRDFRDGLGKRGNAGFPHAQRLVLVAEAVAQNDGVVDGQRQLQNDRDRVGDEADGAAQEVGAHVQQGGGTKSHDEHRHLGVRTGGQRQHQYNDDGGDDDDNAHLGLQVRRRIVADLGVDRGVVVGQLGADLVHGGLGAGIVDLAVKTDREQRGGILVVV